MEKTIQTKHNFRGCDLTKTAAYIGLQQVGLKEKQ